MTRTFTAYVEYDRDAGLYVGTIPGLQGAHTQGATLDELHANLQEVAELCLEAITASGEGVDDDTFVGLQTVDVAV